MTKELDPQGDWLILRTDPNGNIIWKRFLGDVGADVPRKILLLGDGNFVVVGQVYGKLAVVPKDYDGYFLKVSPNGDFLDHYVIPENKREYITNACLSLDGGIVACGFIKHATQNRYEMFAYKLKADFNQGFTETYSFEKETRANCITQLENGEFMIAGYYDVEGNGYYLDPIVIRINPEGDMLRSTRLFTLRNDKFLDIKQRKDGRVIVAGNSTKYMVSGASSSAGVWILDTNGVYLSRNVFGSRSNHSSATSFKINNDTSLILTGYGNIKNNYSASTGFYYYDNAIVAKTDTTGSHQNILSTKPGLDFGLVPVDSCKQDTMFIINNGFHDLSYYVYLSGTNPTGVFNLNEGLTQIDTINSADTIRIIGNYTPNDIRKDSGYFYFKYQLEGNTPNLQIAYTLKGEGVESSIPVELISFTGFSQNNDIILNWQTATETNNAGFEIQEKINGGEYASIAFVIGSGTSTKINNYTYKITNLTPGIYLYRLKQVDLDGSTSYSNEIHVKTVSPLVFNLFQNYPNPFNPVTTITFSIPQDGKVELKVYDVLGNEVATLVNEYREAGSYKVGFNGSTLSSGIYFYTLSAGSFIETKKLAILK